jgi:spore germination protein YaaH
MKRIGIFIFKVVVAVLGIGLGGWLAVVAIGKIPEFKLPRNHQILSLMGIHQHEVVGFLPYWLVNKAQDYSPYLTTLTYFGLTINPDGTIKERSNPQELEPGFNMLNKLALIKILEDAKSKGVKLSLLVANMNHGEILELVSNPENHGKTLVNEVEPIMRERGYSDLNLDFESFTESSESARLQFTQFVRTVKEELTKRQLGTLTVDMSPSVMTHSYIIDPKSIGEIADWVVLMTYDYHYTGSLVTGPVAPLGGAGEQREFDVQIAIREMPNVIPQRKLLLGLPLYGYEWETIDATQSAGVIPGSGRTATNARVEELLADCLQCITGREPSSGERYIIYPDPKDASYRIIFYGDNDLMTEKLTKVTSWGGAAVWALGYESKIGLEPLKSFKNQQLLSP